MKGHRTAEIPTIWKVLERLDSSAIPYMLTGSMAMNFYGHSRATNDVDIVVAITPADSSRLLKMFGRDFYISQEAVDEAFKRTGIFNIIDIKTVFKVDLIIAKDDPFSHARFKRRRNITLGSRSVWVISPEDLILAKLQWSAESLSEMQENDIRNIFRVSGETLDHHYLKNQADAMGYGERLRRLYAEVGYQS